MTNSDWIDIANLVVTSGLGIWIGSTVQRNLTNNRALKEYYINEIKLINEEYSSFLNCLFRDQTTSKNVQEWFKIMQIKLETIQSSIVQELDVYPEVLANHITMKQYLTNTIEFNVQYQANQLSLSPQTKNSILELHRRLKNAIVKIIVDVNRARLKK